MAFSPNPLTKNRVNVNIRNVLGWFRDGERCIMHNNTTELPVTQINLSEADLDDLILRGGGKYPLNRGNNINNNAH